MPPDFRYAAIMPLMPLRFFAVLLDFLLFAAADTFTRTWRAAYRAQHRPRRPIYYAVHCHCHVFAFIHVLPLLYYAFIADATLLSRAAAFFFCYAAAFSSLRPPLPPAFDASLPTRYCYAAASDMILLTPPSLLPLIAAAHDFLLLRCFRCA